MKSYVEKIWGWDEAQQENMLRERFAAAVWQVIRCGDEDAGMLRVDRKPGELFIASILLHPRAQNKGLGTAIIADLVHEGERENLAVTLSVFKSNPARKLYERLGFQVTAEDEVRYVMRRYGTVPG